MAQNTSELIRQAREALKSPQRQRQERENALRESGRDPFAEQLQNMIPINRATQAGREHGRLGGIASLASDTIMGRGGVGGPSAADWLKRMASKIAGSQPGQRDDMIQAAMEAVQREGGTLNPRNAMRKSKSAMLNLREAGGKGTRDSVARAISKAEGRVGSGGEFRLWSETNKNLSKPISLEKFRKARGQLRDTTVSLDQPLTAEGRDTMTDLLRGADNPEAAAILREGFRKLTPAQQSNLARRIQGEEVNPAILKRIQDKLKGGKGETEMSPISGGAGTPTLKLTPMMERTQELTKENLDFLYPTGKVNEHWSSMAHPQARINQMRGVLNPQHADFLALRQANPNIARALMRIDPDTQVPVRFMDPRPGMNAYGTTKVGLGPNNPTEIRLNPNRPAAHQNEVPIHEALHGLYGKNRGLDAARGPNPPAWAGMDIVDKQQESLYGMNLIRDYLSRSNTPNPIGHAALESMSNQIARRSGQNPGLRKFVD